MEPKLLIRSGVAASAIVHLSIVAILLLFAEVYPLEAVTTQPIEVDIVSPEEVPPKEIKPPPQLPETQPSVPEKTSSPSPPAAASPPPKQTGQPAPRVEPQPRPEQTAALTKPTVPPVASPPIPAAVPQEPDLAVKYHVQLGLPENGGFDTAAFKPIDIPVDDTAAFRRHLRKCSSLPPSISASDKLSVKLRVVLKPNGTLSAEPILIEASASPKGPELMQSAIVALRACQPFAMLPAEKYNEWKVLDLSFTPQDFTGG